MYIYRLLLMKTLKTLFKLLYEKMLDMDCSHDGLKKHIMYLEGAAYYGELAQDVSRDLFKESARKQGLRDELAALSLQGDVLEAKIGQSRENNNLTNQTELLHIREKMREICEHETLDEGTCVQCKTKVPLSVRKTKHDELTLRHQELVSMVESYRKNAEKWKPTGKADTDDDDDENITCPTCKMIMPRGLFTFDRGSD